MFTGKQVFIRTKITENGGLVNRAFPGACGDARSKEPRGRLVRALVRGGSLRAGGFPAALSEPAAVALTSEWQSWPADLGREPRPVGQRRSSRRRAEAETEAERPGSPSARPAGPRSAGGHGWKRVPQSRLPAARQRLGPPGGRHPERLEDLLEFGGQGAGGADGLPGGGGGRDLRAYAAAGERTPQAAQRGRPAAPGAGAGAGAARAATSGCVLAWK